MRGADQGSTQAKTANATNAAKRLRKLRRTWLQKIPNQLILTLRLISAFKEANTMAIKIARQTAASDRESPYLRTAGTFLFVVTAADESPVDKDREPLKAFKIEFHVVGGDQNGKILQTLFNDPDPARPDSYTYYAIRQTRILEVLGVIPYQRGKSDQEGVTVELVDRDGNTLIANRLMIGTVKQDGEFFKLDGLKFWHVDDPNAPKISLHPEWMMSIPPELRRDASTFPKPAIALTAANSKANSKPTTKVNVDNMGAAPPPTDDVDDI